MARALRILGTWYVRSWIVIAWSVLCVAIGAAAMFAATIAALDRFGIPVVPELERAIGQR